MAVIMSLDEALEDIKAKEKDNGELIVNRFNKKKFETLLLALANDLNFTTEVVKVKNKEKMTETVEVTKKFRKFCRKLLEAAGVDKMESVRVEIESFIIPSIEGLYEFFTEAMYLYMEYGNQFDFQLKEDFKGGIRLVDVPESVKVYESKNLDGSKNGTIKKKTKKHKKLKAKSSAPSFLSEKWLQ